MNYLLHTHTHTHTHTRRHANFFFRRGSRIYKNYCSRTLRKKVAKKTVVVLPLGGSNLYVFARARARARACVCVCVCVRNCSSRAGEITTASNVTQRVSKFVFLAHADAPIKIFLKIFYFEVYKSKKSFFFFQFLSNFKF